MNYEVVQSEVGKLRPAGHIQPVALFNPAHRAFTLQIVWCLGGTAERVLTFSSAVLGTNPIESLLLCLRPVNGKVKYARRPCPSRRLGDAVVCSGG